MKSMSKLLSSVCLLAIGLSACQNTPLQATRQLRAASVPQATPTQLNPGSEDARYGFRRPVGSLSVNLYTSSDRDIALGHIKEFFKKYVDQNDIVNYQTLFSSNEADKFTINIFGGNQDFVLKKLLPDLSYYLQQRMRFDSLHHYAS